MNCPNCGAPVTADDKFCPVCAYPLKQADQPPAPPGFGQPPGFGPPPGPPPGFGSPPGFGGDPGGFPPPPPGFAPPGPPPPYPGGDYGQQPPPYAPAQNYPGAPPAENYPGAPPAPGYPGAPPGYPGGGGGGYPGGHGQQPGYPGGPGGFAPDGGFGPPPAPPPAVGGYGQPPPYEGGGYPAPPAPMGGGYPGAGTPATPQPPPQPSGPPPFAPSSHESGSADSAERRALAGFLVSFQDDPLGKHWPLFKGKNEVGRADTGQTVAIPISHGTTSTHHAVIEVSDSRITISDLGSTNGTFHNEQAIGFQGTRDLRDGDKIRFGGFSVFFVDVTANLR